MTDRDPFRRYWDDPNRFEVLCRKFVIASLLYYEHNTGSWSDARFDNAAHTMALSYPKLPSWFTERVSSADLRAGTAYALVYTEDERQVANGFLTGLHDIKSSF